MSAYVVLKFLKLLFILFRSSIIFYRSSRSFHLVSKLFQLLPKPTIFNTHQFGHFWFLKFFRRDFFLLLDPALLDIFFDTLTCLVVADIIFELSFTHLHQYFNRLLHKVKNYYTVYIFEFWPFDVKLIFVQTFDFVSWSNFDIEVKLHNPTTNFSRRAFQPRTSSNRILLSLHVFIEIVLFICHAKF